MSIFTNSPDSGPNALSRAAKYLRKRIWLTVVILLVSLGAFGAGLKYLEDDAMQQKALKPKDRSLLSKVNPFLALPTPIPTPQLSKEYIYAGSRLLAVEDANASAVPPADLAVWRPSEGKWYVFGGPGSATVTQVWGIGTGDHPDKPAVGDYDGDGKTDFSVFRPTDSKWYIMYSSNGSGSTIPWGLDSDILAPADYDGDGKTDRAVYRPDDATATYSKWYIQGSNGSWLTPEFGTEEDIPAPADYDGDGKADFGLWRSSNETFYVKYSSNGGTTSFAFDPNNNLSLGSAVPVSSDYDGDGKADFAVFDGAASPYTKWYIRGSASGTMLSTVTFGLPNDIPVQNDYDGDGKCDIAIWRPSIGTWYIINSHDSSWRIQPWGLSGDIPVPAYFRR